MQMSPLSTLALLNSNKSQRKSFCLQIIEQLENGEADPLQVHVFLKNIEQIFKMLTDEKTGKDFAERYRAALLEAASKEGKISNGFEKYNAKFQIKETGIKYDWTKCEDEELNELLVQQEKIDAMVKARQEFLKTVPDSGLIITNGETGETRKVYKPAKSSTTTISVNLS